MSDYLWDKTGEPEEDVAQLENLLGALKYKPRPLDLPADALRKATTTATTAAAATHAHATRPAAFFSRPRLAFAASLILTLLAGAWLVTHRNEPPRNELSQVEQRDASGGSKETAASVVATNAGTDERAGNKVDVNAPPVKDEKLKPRKDGARIVVASGAKPRRALRPSLAGRQKLQPRPEERTNGRREEVARVEGGTRWQVEQPLTPQQREATEQLMFALRLASAKLNYAQREMREIGRAGK